ncbi:MAG: T9SS type A sorting domain-containing protein [Bacteroidales bacterium]|nr:T9SS type A sorting domain-containing protein [Bacteroidales bacterium]
MIRYLAFLILLSSATGLLAQSPKVKTIHKKPVAFAKTAPLWQLTVQLSPNKEDAIPIKKEILNKLHIQKWLNVDKNARPAIVQSKMGKTPGKGPTAGFKGQGGTGYLPPDTDGDVNDDFFVQMVNSKYNVYLKDGTKVLGPLDLGTLWSQLPGGPWGSSGDPIVVYDEEYDRWVLTQFAPKNNYQENYELFAISETSDPTGAYFLYAFEFDNVFNDYPKIGVWSNAYYATYNMFERVDGEFHFVGAALTAVEKEKMIIGDPDAQMIVTPGFGQGYIPGYYSTMPADVDGESFPEENSPCPIIYLNENQDIEVWNFTVDWENPESSTLIKQNQDIVVSSFEPTPNGYNGDQGFIPQPNTSQRLHGMGTMIMNRLAYRKFEDHESMVVNHAVLVDNYSGIRWYEFIKNQEDWELFQEGTYAPNDGVHRWMGSIAINIKGDIGLGYSVSNGEEVFPSIRYTGRRSNDPLGEMTIEEVEIKTGIYSQGHYRWGDYACMNVDPSNDTSFWFTTEYNGWSTWIAEFDLGPLSAATAEAGEDAYICTNSQFSTLGSGTNVLSLKWTSDGDGGFSPNNSFTSNYIRGNQDVANGGCTLTMTVMGYDGVVVSDDMYLNIVPWVFAGEDAVINMNESHQLQAQATDYGEFLWTTTGDGEFNDPSVLQPIYTPGIQDIANSMVELKLNVSVTDPCEDDKEDSLILDILVDVNEEDNMASISVFPNPVQGVFRVDINKLQPKNRYVLKVFNSSGNEIYREQINPNSHSFTKNLNIKSFKDGVYYINVYGADLNKTLKLIKN